MRAPQLQDLPAPQKPARRYAVGEPQKNFGKLPNDYSVLIKEKKLSGAIQRDILWVIMRATWGAEKRPEWASLSLSTIAEDCGGIDQGNLSAELTDLADRKIIQVQERKGCGVKRYKLTPNNWRTAGPYEKKYDPRTSTAAVASNPDTLIVRPGTKGACSPARLTPVGSEPVNFQIAYANIGSVPVSVSSFVDADIVRITFGDHKAKSERKANGSYCRSTIEEKAKPDGNKEVTGKKSFKTVCTELMRNEFEEPFDPETNPSDKKFLSQILHSAGAELPADYYLDYCQQELHRMAMKRKPALAGLLVPFAAQAARKFAATPPPPPPDDSFLAPRLTPEDLQAEAEDNAKCQPCNGTGHRGYFERGEFKMPKGNLGGLCMTCKGTGTKPPAVEA